MSQENVETVRRWLEALSGGSEDFDRALALVHRDVVLVPPGDQPPYRGADSLRRWMEPDAFQEQVVKAFDPVVVTDRTILGKQLITARGATSGIELDVLTWSVWTFDQDGLITRIEIYLDREEDKAREAAGLREDVMSEENVAVVRAGIELWNRGDMDALSELHHPDVIMRAPEGWPEPGPFVGRDAVMRQFRQLRDTWSGDTAKPISDFSTAGDRVVVRVFWSGTGKGPESNVEFTIAYTVRKDRVYFIEYFWDHAEALEAAGLRE
jgi:ketosteroid isomerase-like protein